MKPIYELRSIKEAATRNEFYNFMTIGLKSLLFKAYKMTKVTYPKLVAFETSGKDKEGYPALGSSPLPKKVLEGRPFQALNLPGEDTIEITNYKYGGIIEVSEELVDDDQTGKIKGLFTDRGKGHAKYEDKAVYSIITNNATCYDSQNLFSLNHPGYTGGSAIGSNDNIYTSVSLTANAIAVGLGKIARWTGFTSDDILDVTAKFLVVPENLRHTARVLTESEFLPLAYAAGALGPAASVGQAKNTIKEEGLGVVASPRLDGTSTTDWYIWTDFPGIVFQWRDKLKVFVEDPAAGVRFERELYRQKSRTRFGLKAINWRTGMLVS